MNKLVSSHSIENKYVGDLRTESIHLKSTKIIITDAPLDNNGKGEAFSPTDLVCTALASCILTIMAIAVEKNGISIEGTTVRVSKTMSNEPRMISKINVVINFPSDYDQKTKTILERSAYNCPVHKSLSKEVEKKIEFIYS